MQNSGDGGQNVQEPQKKLMSVEQTQVVLTGGVDSSSEQRREGWGEFCAGLQCIPALLCRIKTTQY